MNSLPRSLLMAGLLCVTLQPCLTMAQTMMDQTVDSATGVLDEIMSVPAKQIPQYLLADAHGIAIIPNVIKGALSSASVTAVAWPWCEMLRGSGIRPSLCRSRAVAWVGRLEFSRPMSC